MPKPAILAHISKLAHLAKVIEHLFKILVLEMTTYSQSDDSNYGRRKHGRAVNRKTAQRDYSLLSEVEAEPLTRYESKLVEAAKDKIEKAAGDRTVDEWVANNSDSLY